MFEMHSGRWKWQSFLLLIIYFEIVIDYNTPSVDFQQFLLIMVKECALVVLSNIISCKIYPQITILDNLIKRKMQMYALNH